MKLLLVISLQSQKPLEPAEIENQPFISSISVRKLQVSKVTGSLVKLEE